MSGLDVKRSSLEDELDLCLNQQGTPTQTVLILPLKETQVPDETAASQHGCK